MLYLCKKIKWEEGAFILDAHEKFIEPLMNILAPKLGLPIEKLFFNSYWLLKKEDALNLDTMYYMTCSLLSIMNY